MRFIKVVGFLIAFFFAGILGGYVSFVLLSDNNNPKSEIREIKQGIIPSQDTSIYQSIIPDGLNFIYAAERVTPAVVHIRIYQQQNFATDPNNPFRRFFHDFLGEEPNNSTPSSGSGSGVIISEDGFIATNYHVVESSSRIEVILDDKRSYTAKVIGLDPSTDLALLKIEESNLPYVQYGNSDNIKIGEWVLAVGNPFDLRSTVTAGIVSAKGRNINILRNQLAIESFIQTDAAVNPGNSGGALVNLEGKLIGVNTAIATRTGSFSGYSFAVPVSIVKKVMDDLLNFGEVQRALLGVIIRDVDANLAKESHLDEIQGVFIEGVNENSAAMDAGLKIGDVILKVDEHPVNSPSELQEQIAKFRPGDEVNIEYLRSGKKEEIEIELKNTAGNTAIVTREYSEIYNDKALSVSLQALDSREKEAYNLRFGIKVIQIYRGLISEQTEMEQGFIITEINEVEIKSIEDYQKVLNNGKAVYEIRGQYPGGIKDFFIIKK